MNILWLFFFKKKKEVVFNVVVVVAAVSAPEVTLRELMPAGNVSHGLAWSYYLNYLRFILPGKTTVKLLIDFNFYML